MSTDLARLLLEAPAPTRRPGFSGTDCKRIMAGDVLDVVNEITGKAEPEDLSSVLPVQLGRYLEPFHLYWFTKTTGITVSALQQQESGVFGLNNVPLYVTLDGMIPGGKNGDSLIPLEMKCVGGFMDMEKILSREYAQLQAQMLCTGTSELHLSVLFLNTRHQIEVVPFDNEYAENMLDRLATVWAYITEGTPMPELLPVEAVRPTEITDHTSNPIWKELEEAWISTKESAGLHAAAIKSLKKLVLPDDQLCFGEKLVARKNKAGAITIKPIAETERKLIEHGVPKE